MALAERINCYGTSYNNTNSYAVRRWKSSQQIAPLAIKEESELSLAAHHAATLSRITTKKATQPSSTDNCNKQMLQQSGHVPMNHISLIQSVHHDWNRTDTAALKPLQSPQYNSGCFLSKVKAQNITTKEEHLRNGNNKPLIQGTVQQHLNSAYNGFHTTQPSALANVYKESTRLDDGQEIGESVNNKNSVKTYKNGSHYRKSVEVSATTASGSGRRQSTAISDMNVRPPKQPSTMLSDEEIRQVKIMFSSNRTKVVVCSCLANLYISEQCAANKTEWELMYTGVPVLVLDSVESLNLRTVPPRRLLSLVLAEKGSGFTLWRDVIDSLSKYTEVERSFQTLFTSENHRKLAGLSFDNAYAAGQFYACLKEFIADPQNVSLRQSNGGAIHGQLATSAEEKRTKRERRHSLGATTKKSWLKKTQISTPCCFQHITSLRPSDVLLGHTDSSESSGTSSGLTTLHSNDIYNQKRAHSCIQIGQIQSYG